MMKQGNLKLTTVILLLFFTNLFSQNWTPIADMEDSRYGAVSFSIGEKGYVAIGQTYTTTKSSVWEYNPSNNTWTQKADFGGGNRRVAFGFSIGNKGYVGAGRDDSGTNGNGILHNDFWEFNPSTNIWTQKANFGGGTRENLTSFVIGDFGYAGLGLRGSRKYDFWKYDPNNDIWIELQEIDPNLHFYNSTSFVLNGFAYYGLGSGFDWVNYNNYTSNKIVKYNPTDDTWSQINNFSGSARINATSFVLNNKAYIGLGRLGGNGACLDDLWEYNDVDDNWQETIVTGLTRSRVSTFTLNNKAYLGNGVSSTQHHQDF
jgi:N-acetylneuraminic acid mutarotase